MVATAARAYLALYNKGQHKKEREQMNTYFSPDCTNSIKNSTIPCRHRQAKTPVCSNTSFVAGGSSFEVAAFQLLPQRSSSSPSGTAKPSSDSTRLGRVLSAFCAAACDPTSSLKPSTKLRGRKYLLSKMRSSHVPAILSRF